MLLGFRLFTGVASNRVTELLKKFVAGLSAVERFNPLSNNWSPKIGLSPSKVANAKFARTGAGAGIVLNPETGISNRRQRVAGHFLRSFPSQWLQDG